MNTPIEFTRVNNDVNGNPRYVCHYVNLLSQSDRENKAANVANWLNEMYDTAIKRAKKIGGRKFHNKQYGGGIVFQSYNIEDLERRIKELINAN